MFVVPDDCPSISFPVGPPPAAAALSLEYNWRRAPRRRRIGITHCHCYSINFLAIRDRGKFRLEEFGLILVHRGNTLKIKH